MNPSLDGQRLRLVRLLAILFSLLILAIDVATAFTSATPPQITDLGGIAARPLASVGKLQVLVDGVEPGSPAAAAGIKAGDRIEFPHYPDFLSKAVGREAHLIVYSDGVARTASIAWRVKSEVTTPPYKKALWALDIYTSVLTVLLGVIVLARGQVRRSTIAIGLLLVCFGYNGYALYLPPAAPDAILVAMNAFDRARLAASNVLLLYFARWLFEEEIGPLRPRVRAVSHALVGVIVVYALASVLSLLSGYAVGILKNYSPLESVIEALSCVLSFSLLWSGWSRSSQQSRLKYAVLVASLSAFVLSFVSGSLIWLNWVFYPAMEFLSLVFVCSFSYAVLRHKVVDLGFVINRAVVYGVISAVILVTFGLAEWMAEHVVHFEDRKESALLDGGIALATYLVFHRIKHGVEHWIEKVFFRSWHDNEARLRRFVREAAYITNVDALWEQLERELGRFSGAPCRVFVRTTADGFHAADRHADAPVLRRIGENSRLALALQADRKPVVIHDEPSVQKGSLAAAVFLGGALQAIVVIEARGNGVPFRPDEIDAIGDAVTTVGNDYLTLRLNYMERRDVEKEQLLMLRNAECSMLRSQLAE